jgi:hypothetical protein
MKLITIILPIDPRINCKDKERVEALFNNIIILFGNEKPWISNGDSKLLVAVVRNLTIDINTTHKRAA